MYSRDNLPLESHSMTISASFYSRNYLVCKSQNKLSVIIFRHQNFETLVSHSIHHPSNGRSIINPYSFSPSPPPTFTLANISNTSLKDQSYDGDPNICSRSITIAIANEVSKPGCTIRRKTSRPKVMPLAGSFLLISINCRLLSSTTAQHRCK